ncbi:MAG: hypothetical protein LUD50_04570 [Clostridia bacterium]|nr:hypothetical protein [Clostridia bacterium]MCD8286478.1 hypothetical protein [Clostridia bacterium]
MERLTREIYQGGMRTFVVPKGLTPYRYAGAVNCSVRAEITACLERLAEYEDLDMTPEEMKQAIKRMNQVMKENLASDTEGQ